jgi:hypothetical protein
LVENGRKMNGKENQKTLDFLKGLLDYYKNFVGDSSKSVRKLAQLQKKYPKNYDDFKESQADPTAMLEMTEKLTGEEKAILFELIFRMSDLTRRAINVINLDVKQQEKLADDLEEFAKDTETKLKSLIEKKKEG